MIISYNKRPQSHFALWLWHMWLVLSESLKNHDFWPQVSDDSRNEQWDPRQKMFPLTALCAPILLSWALSCGQSAEERPVDSSLAGGGGGLGCWLICNLRRSLTRQ